MLRVNNPDSLKPKRSGQQGIALAISLVLLVAITVLGVATLTGTRLNEQITGNAQQKTIAFEVAESGINAVWNDKQSLIDSLLAIPADQFDNPAPITPPGFGAVLDAEYDQLNTAGDTVVDISAGVEVRYCGENLLPEGTGLNADESIVQTVGLQFDIVANAEIQNSSTRAVHTQRGEYPGPSTGRAANCVSPGL